MHTHLSLYTHRVSSLGFLLVEMPTVGVDDRRSPPFLPPGTAEEQELELLIIEKARNLVLKSDGIGNGDGDNGAGGFRSSGVLPLRPYAGDCPHYVRTATCKFGPSCRYNHPVKKIQQGFNGGGSVFDKSGRIECKYFSTAGGCRYGKSCRYSHPGEESEVTHPQLNQLGLPPRMASSYLPRTGNYYSAPNTDGSLWKLDFPVSVDEFPERPGEPDCDYFMKTGNCKFKSTCRFHHPKNRPDELVLNENGLPLRPGKSVCWHYERHGLCKFGRACLFDHPAIHGLSTYPQWNSLKNVVAAAAAADDDGCNGGGWDD